LDQELAEVKESTLWSGRSSPDDEASQVQVNQDFRSWGDPCTNVSKLLPHAWKENFESEVEGRRNAIIEMLVADQHGA